MKMSETKLINRNVGITSLRTAAIRSHSAGISVITDHTTVPRTSTLKTTVRAPMDGEATSSDHVVHRDRPRSRGADPAGTVEAATLTVFWDQ